MIRDHASMARTPEARLVAAAMDGDEVAFAALTERYRRQLQVHCYRMVGSIEEAEDLVQETFLRAWRMRSSFRRDSLYRTWLYQIATNVCLDALRARKRRVLPTDLGPAGDPADPLPNAMDAPWLQPYPDRLLEPASAAANEPDAMAVERETIELAFLVSIQALPPRQRAVLIMRDVLDWSAAETATLFDISVQAVNSSLQRAHETMRRKLPRQRQSWAPLSRPSADELALLARYMEAHERADSSILAGLLRDDVRLSMPPMPIWLDGRVDVLAFHLDNVFAPSVGHIRGLATAANRQPAAALYLRAPGDDVYRPLAIDVLRFEGDSISEITSFVSPELFAAFGLPESLA